MFDHEAQRDAERLVRQQHVLRVLWSRKGRAITHFVMVFSVCSFRVL